MENRDLIRMANQIAAYFDAYPRTEALDGIAAHIKNFWSPRMRTQLGEYIDGGAEELSPLVTAALAPKAKPKAKAKA
jgi:formate dehydrogenase subunit delta